MVLLKYGFGTCPTSRGVERQLAFRVAPARRQGAERLLSGVLMLLLYGHGLGASCLCTFVQ